MDTGNDARGGMEKDKHISHSLLDSVLRANETLALPFAELAQTLYAILSGIVDLNILICEEEFGGCGCSQQGCHPLKIASRSTARQA